MAKGIGRKELREPDEFLTLTGQALDYAKRHEREVTYVAIALAVVMVFSLGVRWYRDWQHDKAEAAFGAARRDFSAARFETAVTGFDRVSREWPRTTFGPLALVYKGNCYAELAKPKEAEEAFRAALAVARDPLVQQIAHYNLGLLQVKAGDKKAASAELGAAAQIEGPLRAAAWFARLGSQEQFVEDISGGMQAIDELAPEARQYVDAQIGAQASQTKAEKPVTAGAVQGLEP